MARIRTVKPEFFLSEQVASCSPLARILFVGLWVHADREGRLEDRPVRIKAQVLPYDKADIEALLSELVAANLIRRYEAKGLRCIDIPQFAKHQRPHPKEAPSSIEPFNFTASNDPAVKRIERAATFPGGLWTMDNGLRTMDKGREGKGAETREGPAARDVEAEFRELWNACEKQVGEHEAQREYLFAVDRGCPPVAEIISAMRALQSGPAWRAEGRRGQPNLGNWLKRDGWKERIVGGDTRRRMGTDPERDEAFANLGKDRVIDMDKLG